VALVLVLWMMVVLGAVALQRGLATHLRAQATAALSQESQAFYLARAGVEAAVRGLMDNRDKRPSDPEAAPPQGDDCTNVELGRGSYTLFRQLDPNGEPLRGLIDEGGKININTAAEEVIAKLPGMPPDLAALIVAGRGREYHNINDLLLLEGVTVSDLWGEDVNGNGLLDPNEDDGDRSWPPDDGDGRLATGWAAWLTVCSASRDVTADGVKRVNLNTANAEEIAKASSEIKKEEADAIVAQRNSKKFAGVLDLLDVKPSSGNSESKPQSGEQKQQNGEPSNSAPPNENSKNSNQAQGNPPSQGNQPNSGAQPNLFDISRVRRVMDLFTVSEDGVVKGLVNVNDAPVEVLQCLPGITEAVASEIVTVREKQKPFDTVDQLLDVEGVTLDLFRQFYPFVTTRTDVYTVRSFGAVSGGETVCAVEAVVDRTQDAARVLRWREME
jgi:DNA uptake protein ComE-like DNA-binding protein